MPRRSFAGLLTVGMLILLFGCKAKPLPDSDFLDQPLLMKPNPRLPFDRSYIDPHYNPDHYDKLIVRPIDTEFLFTANIWELANIADANPNIDDELRDLTHYAQGAFVYAAEHDPRHHFTIGTQPGPRTLILESAIVQLVPSKVVLNAVSLVYWQPLLAGFVGQIIFDSEAGDNGVIAIEIQLRDAQTGRIVFEMADRERPPDALFNLKSYTWWQPIRSTLNDWAAQFIDAAGGPQGQKIKASKHFGWLIF